MCDLTDSQGELRRIVGIVLFNCAGVHKVHRYGVIFMASTTFKCIASTPTTYSLHTHTEGGRERERERMREREKERERRRKRSIELERKRER